MKNHNKLGLIRDIQPFTKTCRQCNTEFTTHTRNHKYCSRDCVLNYNIDNKKDISGIGMYPGSVVNSARLSQQRNDRDLKKYRDAQTGRLNPKL